MVFMQKKKSPEKKKENSTSDSRIIEAANAALSDKNKPSDKGENIENASLLWSVIPGSNDNTLSGQMFSYTFCSLASAKKRIWIVMIDRALFFYKTSSDLVPVDYVPLRHCALSKTGAEGIITVTRTKGDPFTWFLYSPVHQQRNIWWRVLDEEHRTEKCV